MILVNDLIGLMAKHGFTNKAMAKCLGMSPKTFGLKLKKGVFGSDEIEVMIKLLDIENPADIFFAH